MKFQIDLVVMSAYCGLIWAYASLPDPNWWVFGFILLMTFAIDVRSHKTGMDRGGEIMQKIMRDTLDDKGWEIVRTKR